MSSITGIFCRNDTTVESNDIIKMNNKLSHRGPDGSKTWCEGPIALAHQMLHTTPESLQEELPFEDEESGLVITADARIDNRKELSDLLELENSLEVPDSHFILNAYKKWGVKCPEKLLGDFSFAIWDKKNEKLFCARDHMGVKPFYYFLSSKSFYFATEIKALHYHDEVPKKLNDLMLAFHLTSVTDERKLTFYKKIFRLPAAHSLLVDSSNLKIRRYWKLDPSLNLQLDSDADYINHFRLLFTEAVNCRLRSAYPVGFELSGGLDSSSIVCVAKKLIKDNYPLNTFSLVTEKFPESDERYYIKKIIDLGGIESHFLVVDEISPFRNLEDIFSQLQQPFTSPNIAPKLILNKKIQKKGNKIILSGHDGDSVLSHGEKYFKELFLDFHWKTLIKELSGYSKIKNKNLIDLFLFKIIIPSIPLPFTKLWSNNKNPKTIRDFVLNNIKLNNELNIKEKFKSYDKSLINPNTAKEFHYSLIVQGSHQDSFETYDRLASGFFEPRFPFFDKRLIEFCFSIPTEQKFKFGWDRILLRRSMDDILPVEVQWRPRKRFVGSVLQKNFLKLEEERLNDLFFKKCSITKKFVDPNDVKKIYETYKQSDNSREKDFRGLYALSTLILWLQKTEISR